MRENLTANGKNLINGGFTLMELLVALVTASVVTLVALHFYVGSYRTFGTLFNEYQKESAELLDKVRRANPYASGALRGVPPTGTMRTKR